MSEMDEKRAALAGLLARREGIDPQDRATLDRRVETALDSFDPDAPEPSDPADAERHRLLRDLRGLRELRADRNNVRLAEKGEVFAPEDDA
ncbi:MAG TPA: hypothetical protein K8W01_14625 [Methylorubrum populi]|uniref:Uncharacterized protein n=1 Tax=Methylorubrum populi TaxID=223967 RepID=A0A921E5F8_9HYPH|nr:hypothetical protein [Methylorubrum populi]